MAEYIATFTTGFERIIPKQLCKELNGARIINIYDGLVHFNYSGHIDKLSHLAFLNNIFYVFRSFKRTPPKGKDTGELSFEQMIKACSKDKIKAPLIRRSFRIRYSKENRFTRVERQSMSQAERQIRSCTGMQINRNKPDCEFWYIIRSRGQAYFCELVSQRKATEKDLHQGELRPEFANLLVACCSKIRDGAKLCDPFCGYCAIEKELGHCKQKSIQVYASDLNSDLISAARGTFNDKASTATRRVHFDFNCADARNLKHIKDGSIDAIITDPPWGFYENIADIEGFYLECLDEFLRVLKSNGQIVLLSAKKNEFRAACDRIGLKISEQIDTLVNGKKAAVFIIKVK